jgi:serine/threonine protein phosphatase PrpC
MGIGMSLGGWRYVAASVIGTSHEKAGGPCQDANQCQIYSLPNGEKILAAAIADGAGSAAYGGEGAAATCRALLGLMNQHVCLDNTVEQITRDTVASWIATIQNLLDEEAKSVDRERREFACTVLGLMIGESSAACLQVGDGVMVLADSEERTYNHVFWPDRGEYANMTHFVTQDDAIEHLQFESISRRIVEAALLTDGLQNVALNYQEQTAYEPFFKGLFAPLRAAAEGNSPTLTDSLAAFLSSPRVNEKTDDDKTLVLASRFESASANTGA